MVMASAGVNMPGGDGNPEWRARRRRRLEPPRASTAGSSSGATWDEEDEAEEQRRARLRQALLPTTPSSSSPAPPPPEGGDEAGGAEEQQGEEEEEEEAGEAVEDELPPAAGLQLPAAQPQAAARAWPVAFGSLSIAGRMRTMEDTVSLRPAFCTWADGSPMHFFGVFDGHGGSHVSTLCRDRMHAFLAEELAKEGEAFRRRRQAMSSSEEERAWRAALSRCFQRVDALAALACACGRMARPRCPCAISGNPAGIVGSTAVVALLVRGRLVVANCGDSRAVLCRGPAGSPPVPLSSDHKPNRPDELARIESVGGQVVFNNGARVRGILAMTRALGDRLLRPEVIAEPEITITDRTAEDECLILASDGMWDVIPNEIACNVARHCLQDGNPPPVHPAAAGGAAAAAVPAIGHEAEPRCYRAASLLARLAIGRETPDNISIVIIDLKQRE